MKVSTTLRYGLRFLVRLSMEPEGGLNARQAARAEGIPENYLRQIILLIERSGLIKSRRGPRGGYFLSRDPKDIRVMEVVKALQGGSALVPCFEEGACDRSEICAARELWREAEESLRRVFEGKTLKDLAERQKILEVKDGLSR